MSKPQLIPVCANTTGWPVIGYACNEQQARRVVLRSIGDHSKSLIDDYKFNLNVFRRTPLARELNGGPDSFTWSVGR